MPTTTIGYNTSTWSNISFGDTLGVFVVFIAIGVIALVIFRLIAMFKRYNRTR